MRNDNDEPFVKYRKEKDNKGSKTKQAGSNTNGAACVDLSLHLGNTGHRAKVANVVEGVVGHGIADAR